MDDDARMQGAGLACAYEFCQATSAAASVAGWRSGGAGALLLDSADGTSAQLVFRSRAGHDRVRLDLEPTARASMAPVVAYKFPKLVVAVADRDQHDVWMKHSWTMAGEVDQALCDVLVQTIAAVWEGSGPARVRHDDEDRRLRQYIALISDQAEFREYCQLVRQVLRGDQAAVAAAAVEPRCV